MFSSIGILFLLPFFQTLFIRNADLYFGMHESGSYIIIQVVHKVFYWIFIFNFVLLGYLGSQPAIEPFITISLYSTIVYFFFLTIGYSFAQFYDLFAFWTVFKEQNELIQKNKK